MNTALPAPQIENGRVFAPLLDDWLLNQPEERVRQSFILHLHHHYGYAFEQMAQQQRTQSGTRSSRVDIAVWATVEDAQRTPRPAPVLVVECKAATVDIHPRDYYQGESYARAVGEPCEFVVMHNQRQTAVFRLVRGLPGELVQVNDFPKAGDWSDARRLRALREDQRAFNRKEFQDLLHRCHGILRDTHKMEPGRAFDAISKILFIKMYVERTGTHGTFTTDFIDQRKKTHLKGDKPVHEGLFDLTKQHYSEDEIFAADDSLDVSEATFRRIVKELERFNLSATGDDVKGLAFERFLGDTFRGNLGQYFTPRPVVDFMVDLLDPQEEELICDPAAGSGGFLIRAFEHVRAQIEADIQEKKDVARAQIEDQDLGEDEEERRVEYAFAELNRELDPDEQDPPSRMRRLSRDFIFGTDAESRAARTAKMNMIMHGDGHGGIHYHDGLVDVNGIFPERFDVVLSNPPFGANVGADQIVGETEQTRGPFDKDIIQRARSRYGADWQLAHDAFLVATKDGKRTDKQGKLPVLGLYEIGMGKPNRPTELLFVERCIDLLKPGGRCGIVLPDGNLNNPSLGWLRRWAEGKARLIAVVSLPEDMSSGRLTTAISRALPSA
ncbi:MAG: N-6 DNA methylase, partial [Bacteroidota bacterium]